MVERVTPDSAIVGDIVRLSNGQEGRVVAARPAGNNFVDVQLEDGLMWVTGNYEIVQRAQHPAVSDAVTSAHLSGVDVPADHVETLEAVARGEVTADDAVQAVVDSALRARIAAEFIRHLYWNPGTCECGWKVDEAGDVDWQTQFRAHVAQSIVDSSVAPMLAERDRRLALAEAALEPARHAFADLAEARQLLRQALADAASFIEAQRADVDLLRAEFDRLNLDLQGYQGDGAYEKGWEHGAATAAKFRAEADRLRAERDEAREYVADLLLETNRSWTGWSDEVPDGVEEARREIERLRAELEQWRTGPLVVLDAPLPIGRPDTEATEQAPKTLADKFVDAAVAEVNRINSTTSRKPRVWRKGEPMPEDVGKVSDVHGDVWTRNVIDEWTTPETKPCGWPYMAKKWAPLTEVIVDGES